MVHTATRLFPGSPAAVSSYKGYIGIDRKSGDIAHYGKNFANGDRYGHWDIIINGVWPRGGTEHFVVSLKQSTQKGTRWLSANGSGGMGSETRNSSDEKFVIMGSTKKCRVQRYDNFKAGHGHGRDHQSQCRVPDSTTFVNVYDHFCFPGHMALLLSSDVWIEICDWAGNGVP